MYDVICMIQFAQCNLHDAIFMMQFAWCTSYSIQPKTNIAPQPPALEATPSSEEHQEKQLYLSVSENVCGCEEII